MWALAYVSTSKIKTYPTVNTPFRMVWSEKQLLQQTYASVFQQKCVSNWKHFHGKVTLHPRIQINISLTLKQPQMLIENLKLFIFLCFAHKVHLMHYISSVLIPQDSAVMFKLLDCVHALMVGTLNQFPGTYPTKSFSATQRYGHRIGKRSLGRQYGSRQTGRRQIKRTLLVSAHCTTLISFHFLIGWLL